MSLFLTALGSDSFGYANIDPLPSPPWSVLPGVYSTYNLQVVDNLCVPSIFETSCYENFTSVVSPNDSYCSATTTLSPHNDNYLFLGVRYTPQNNYSFYTCYEAYFYNAGTGFGASSNGQMYVFSYVNGSGTFLGGQGGIQTNPNDTFSIVALGGTVYILQNGSQLVSFSNSSVSSGPTTLLGLETLTTGVTNAEVSYFETGIASTNPVIVGNCGVSGATVSWTGPSSGSTTSNSSGAFYTTGLANGSYTIVPTLQGYSFSPASRVVVINGASQTGINFTPTVVTAWSQLDCRIHPNTAVPTNNTNIYTGQTSSNHGIPPIDSRKKKPVACGTYPQNSRTSPPFKS